MTNPIKIRARASGEETTVRVLMPHPMESGNRKDASGALKPAHFITDVLVTCNAVPVMKAKFGPSVARDPLLTFKFRGGPPGASIRVVWNDNLGVSSSAEALVVAGRAAGG